MGAVCNGLTIIFLGLIGTGSDHTGRYDFNHSQGGMLRGNKARVGPVDSDRCVCSLFWNTPSTAPLVPQPAVV